MENEAMDADDNNGWLKKYNLTVGPDYTKICYVKPEKSQDTIKKTRGPKSEYCRYFKTGSFYKGEWSTIDMHGFGKYVFPHGVIYEGEMKNGEFHGEGQLTYPKGQSIKGQFRNGEMVSWEFYFGQDQDYSLKNYCKFPDRRYMRTLEEGYKPPGKERLTQRQPERRIPKGHYDVEDGFYNPQTGWIYSAASFSKKKGANPMRMPLRRVKPIESDKFISEGNSFIKKVPFVPVYQDEKFILKRCRKAWDEPTGYRPDLYEKWMSGRAKETERYRKKFSSRTILEEPDSNCLKLLEFFHKIGEELRSKTRVLSHSSGVDVE